MEFIVSSLLLGVAIVCNTLMIHWLRKEIRELQRRKGA